VSSELSPTHSSNAAEVKIRMPRELADEVRRVAQHDRASMSSTVRRLIARGVALEAAAWRHGIVTEAEAR
jgi:hypothetical protein